MNYIVLSVGGGTIVWIIKDATINGSETGTSFKHALYFKEIGMNIHDTMIWKKPTFTNVGAYRERYFDVFEYMFIFTKGKIKTFNPLKDRINITMNRKKHGTIRQVNGSTRQQSSIGKIYNNKFGQRFNVWEINTLVSNTERTGHPAQFPLELAQDHVLSWTNPEDIVLDPFMGSGTTGVACLNTGRNFIGIEMNKDYYNIARNRIVKDSQLPTSKDVSL